MRKIFYIFILMVSSFFVFNTDVKADTLSYIIDEKDFTYLNEDFYTIRELAIDYSESHGYDYIIHHSSNKFYVFYIQQPASYSLSNYSHNIGIFPIINISSTVIRYKYTSGTLVYDKEYTSYTIYLADNIYSTSPVFLYKFYLDSNIKIPITTTEHNYTLTYNDFSYSFTSSEHFPSLYEFKTIMENPPAQEPERNESLDSFYYLIMEKIELFANYFITNSTLLFIIGIIILIFIIELIFRRYL